MSPSYRICNIRLNKESLRANLIATFFFGLLFNGQRDSPSPTQQQQKSGGASKPHGKDDSADFVDKSGFGFGPAKGTHAHPAPYSKDGSRGEPASGKRFAPASSPAEARAADANPRR